MIGYFNASNSRIANGTSNQNHLVKGEDMIWLETIKPQQLQEVFGEGISGFADDGKGYGDTEWYFETSGSRQVWGIGWRYGRTRLRGSGFASECQSTEQGAAAFINWLQHRLEKYTIISRENV